MNSTLHRLHCRCLSSTFWLLRSSRSTDFSHSVHCQCKSMGQWSRFQSPSPETCNILILHAPRLLMHWVQSSLHSQMHTWLWNTRARKPNYWFGKYHINQFIDFLHSRLNHIHNNRRHIINRILRPRVKRQGITSSSCQFQCLALHNNRSRSSPRNNLNCSIHCHRSHHL